MSSAEKPPKKKRKGKNSNSGNISSATNISTCSPSGMAASPMGTMSPIMNNMPQTPMYGNPQNSITPVPYPHFSGMVPTQGPPYHMALSAPHPSSSPPGDSTPPWARDIILKVDALSEKLKILDSISVTVNELKRDMNTIQERVSDVEKSQNFINTQFEENKVAVMNVERDLNNIKQAVDSAITCNKSLSDDIVDLQARSMRDNLLFFGIDEAADNDVNENCIEAVQKFCAEKLEIDDTLVLERAHRIGKRKQGKPRPIVVKFNRFQQRETVRHSSSKLKDSRYSITEQYPKPIQENRKRLWPIYKEARAAKKRVSMVRDKLYIEGQLYTGPLPQLHNTDETAPKDYTERRGRGRNH